MWSCLFCGVVRKLGAGNGCHSNCKFRSDRILTIIGKFRHKKPLPCVILLHEDPASVWALRLLDHVTGGKKLALVPDVRKICIQKCSRVE